MGNSPSKKNTTKHLNKNVTQLIDINIQNDQYAQEQYTHVTNCCGMQFSKTQKRKIIWQNNFITYCNMIKDQFKWANQLIQLINHNRQIKTHYFKEINNLKLEINNNLQSQRQILISPSEVQQFKSNLKKSVLVSCSQTSKFFPQTPHRIISSNPMKSSKIQISRFKQKSFHISSNKKLQRSPSISSSKSGLRKSIMSFVDDTLSSVFGNQRQISKLLAKQLQIFLKFSMIIQKHFNDPKCMLYQIKKKFIDFIARNYSDYSNVNNKIDQLIDSINHMVKILKQTLIDYYNLNIFIQGQISHNPFISNEDNLLSICTTILFKQKLFYQIIWNNCIKFNQQRQKNFEKLINILQKQTPNTFFIKQKFCLNQKTIQSSIKNIQKISDSIHIQNQQPYQQCKIILNQLAHSKSPISKMKIIYSCSEMMNKQIQKFYDINGLQRQKWVLDADQVLSIFCYIIVGAKIKHLHTHLFILDNFSTSSQMISIFGYYLSVMNCAVQQLENDYIDKLENMQANL